MSDMSQPRLGEPLAVVRGRGVVVPGDDIDTDRIIPARFLKCVTFDGLGEHAFADERRDEAGAPVGHPLDDPRFVGAGVLVTGRNFGCGSSREHAPQALFRAGLRAILAPSFAEIFLGNCTTIGLVCAVVSGETARALAAAVHDDPAAELTVDVRESVVRLGATSWPLGQPGPVREALLSGRWDPLAALRQRADQVAEVAKRLPYAAWG